MTKFLKLTCFVSIILMAGCTKDKTQQIKEQSAETQKQVNAAGITFSPASGINFTAVTINGSFSTTPGANVVKFNGVTGIINSVSANKIVVTVPATATTGKVSVTTNSITTTSSTDFKVLKLVKERSFTTNFYISKLSFDRSGNGVTYALTPTGVNKIAANGAISTLYDSPPVSYPKYYALRGFDNDGLGNVYITRVLYKDSTYTIPPDVINTTTRLLSSVVLKINAAGQATKLLGDGLRKTLDGLSPLMIDAKGQNLVLAYADKSTPLLRVSRSGALQNISGLSPVNDFCLDKDDNFYTILNGKLSKVNTAGVATYLCGKGGEGQKDGPADVATLTLPQGIIVDGAQNILMLNAYYAFRVVNTAGYAGTLSVEVPDTSGSNAMYFNRFTNKIYIIGGSQSGGLIHQYAIK
ncbi:MAG: hypothetical protein EOP47_13485 [Sphingobacteriaceae bacterium]|nr:MAG: hypothetical protein EOP47_13485 [Sphingobacteriaceae bacterium]